MSRPKVKHLDLDMAALEAILERTRSGPLSEEEHHRLIEVVSREAIPAFSSRPTPPSVTDSARSSS